jgi:hypothetical protein
MAVTLLVTLSAQAQFPAEVKEVLKKCNEKMASYGTDDGVVMDMDVRVKVSILSMNGTLKMYGKNKKYFSVLSMKMMSEEIKTEFGFDGNQKWEFRAATDKEEKDSLFITKTQSSVNKFGVKSDYESEYKNAKMKEKGLYYEITFSGPKKKDVSKTATIKIAKSNYLLREYSTDIDKGKMFMTITKITKGCSDNWFKLDMNRYKNAAVVRK